MEALVYLPDGEVVEMLTMRDSGAVRFSAWEPAVGLEGHGTLTTFRGRLYGRIASRAHGDAGAHRAHAHALIRLAFPDAARAAPDYLEPGDLRHEPTSPTSSAPRAVALSPPAVRPSTPVRRPRRARPRA